MLLAHHIENIVNVNLHNARILNTKIIVQKKSMKEVTITEYEHVKKLCHNVLNYEPNNYYALSVLKDTLWYSKIPKQEQEIPREFLTKELLKLAQTNIRLIYNLGFCLKRQKKYKEAIDTFVQVIRHPDYFTMFKTIDIPKQIYICYSKIKTQKH